MGLIYLYLIGMDWLGLRQNHFQKLILNLMSVAHLFRCLVIGCFLVLTVMGDWADMIFM